MLGTMTALNFWALQHLQAGRDRSHPVLGAAAHRPAQRLVAGRAAGRAALAGHRRGPGGVLLVVRPGTQAFHPALLLSVGNAFLYACFNMLTRRLAATESPASLQLMSAIGATILLTPFALLHWQWPASARAWAR
jgi:hypothetical protein